MAEQKTGLVINIGATDTASKVIKNLESGIIRFVGAVASSLAAITAVAFPITQAASFEREMKNVQKTTGFTDDQIKILSDSLLELSSTMSVTAQDLAAIAATGGQLGLGKDGIDAINAFTASVARANVTLGFTADAAAEVAAQLLNIFKIPTGDAEKIFSVLNELSNTSVATADALADITKRVGDVAGLTFQQSAALAAFARDLGISQEVAGTSLSTFFTRMQSMAEDFSKAVGLSQQEWITILRTDAVQALQLVATELSKLDSVSQATAISTLFGTGRQGAFATKIVNDAATGFQILNQHVASANRAFDEGDSSIKEYEKVMEALTEQTKTLVNEFRAIAIEIGTEFIPKIKGYIQSIRELVRSEQFQNAMRELGNILGAVVDAVGALTNALAAMNIQWGNVIQAVGIFLGFKFVSFLAGLSFGIGKVEEGAKKAAKSVGLLGAAFAAILGASNGPTAILGRVVTLFGLIPLAVVSAINAIDRFGVGLVGGTFAPGVRNATSLLTLLRNVLFAIPLAMARTTAALFAGAGAMAALSRGVLTLNLGLKSLALLVARAGPIGILITVFALFHRQIFEMLGLVSREEAVVAAKAVEQQLAFERRVRETDQAINTLQQRLRSGVLDVKQVKIEEFFDLSFSGGDASKVGKSISDFLDAGIQQAKQLTEISLAKELLEDAALSQEENLLTEQFVQMSRAVGDSQVQLRVLSEELRTLKSEYDQLSVASGSAFFAGEATTQQVRMEQIQTEMRRVVLQIENAAQETEKFEKALDEIVDRSLQLNSTFEDLDNRQRAVTENLKLQFTQEGVGALNELLQLIPLEKQYAGLLEERSRLTKELEELNITDRSSKEDIDKATELQDTIRGLSADVSSFELKRKKATEELLNSLSATGPATQQLLLSLVPGLVESEELFRKVSEAAEDLSKQENIGRTLTEDARLDKVTAEIVKWSIEAETATREIEAFNRKTQGTLSVVKSLNGIFDNVFKTAQAGFENATKFQDEIDNLKFDKRLEDQLSDKTFLIDLDFDFKEDAINRKFDKLIKDRGLDDIDVEDPRQVRALANLEKRREIELRNVEKRREATKATAEYETLIAQAKDRDRDITEEIKNFQELEKTLSELSKKDPTSDQTQETARQLEFSVNKIKDLMKEVNELSREARDVGFTRTDFGTSAIDEGQIRRDLKLLEDSQKTFTSLTGRGEDLLEKIDQLKRTLNEVEFRTTRTPELEAQQAILNNANAQIQALIKDFPTLTSFASEFANQMKIAGEEAKNFPDAFVDLRIADFLGTDSISFTEEAETLKRLVQESTAAAIRNASDSTEIKQAKEELLTKLFTDDEGFIDLTESVTKALDTASRNTTFDGSALARSLTSSINEELKDSGSEVRLPNLVGDTDSLQDSIGDREYLIKLKGELDLGDGTTIPIGGQARGGLVTPSLSPVRRDGSGHTYITPIRRARGGLVYDEDEEERRRKRRGVYIDPIRRARGGIVGRESGRTYNTGHRYSGSSSSFVSSDHRYVDRYLSASASLARAGRFMESVEHNVRQLQQAEELSGHSTLVEQIAKHTEALRKTKDDNESARHVSAIVQLAKEIRSFGVEQNVASYLEGIEHTISSLNATQEYGLAERYAADIRNLVDKTEASKEVLFASINSQALDIFLSDVRAKEETEGSSKSRAFSMYLDNMEQVSKGLRSYYESARDMSDLSRKMSEVADVQAYKDTAGELKSKVEEFRSLNQWHMSGSYLESIEQIANGMRSLSTSRDSHVGVAVVAGIARELRSIQELASRSGTAETRALTEAIEHNVKSYRSAKLSAESEENSARAFERMSKLSTRKDRKDVGSEFAQRYTENDLIARTLDSAMSDSRYWLDSGRRHSEYVDSLPEPIRRARGGRVYDEEEERRRKRTWNSSAHITEKAIHKAKGGRIAGKGTSTSDSILAWLSNGEFVMDAWTTRYFGANFFEELQSIARAGLMPKLQMPKYARGGSVGEPIPALLSNTSMVDSLLTTDSQQVTETIELIVKDELGDELGRLRGPADEVRRIADVLKSVKRR